MGAAACACHETMLTPAYCNSEINLRRAWLPRGVATCPRELSEPSPYATNKANLIEMLTYCRARA